MLSAQPSANYTVFSFFLKKIENKKQETVKKHYKFIKIYQI